MGRTKWFRSNDLLMLLRGAVTVFSALARFIAQHIGSNGGKKGGGSSRKKPVKRKT